jgi:hypothetical protein
MEIRIEIEAIFRRIRITTIEVVRNIRDVYTAKPLRSNRRSVIIFNLVANSDLKNRYKDED